MKKPNEIIDEIKRNALPKVKVAVSDIDGILRGKYLHRDKFLSAVDSGFGFCNVVFGWDSGDVCYDNNTYTGWHTGYPDAQAKVDLSTYRHVPWDQKIPFFLGEFVDTNGHPLEICPRQTLKRVLDKANRMGFKALCGMEFEWFNFKETSQTLAEKKYVGPEPITPGMFGYSLVRIHQNQPFFQALMDELREFQIPIEGLHTETGPGVLEAAILFDEALECADRAILFKTSVKEIGQRFGIMPSFMAKWNAALPGCSGHIHQSLWDTGLSRNLFFDEKNPLKMSEVFRSFIAGQMHCLPEILPMVAPTINSYKRLVDGYWAPTKVTWGVDNRTVVCRAIPGSSKSTRLEFRVPGSDVNPYLAVAASLAAGLYGIEKKLKLKASPVQGSAYMEKDAVRLSHNLHDATVKMEKSELARELFGEKFVNHFVETRHWEWRQFQTAVTNWEIQRYFEII